MMSKAPLSPNSKSLLAKHGKILGLEFGSGDVDSSKEMELMNQLDVPDLQLIKSKSNRRIVQWLAVSGIAAAAVFAILPHNTHQDHLTEKGGGKINIYYRYDGEARQFAPGTKLHAGAQVRVEVVSPVNALAYLQVFDNQHNALTRLDRVQDRELIVSPNEPRGTFSGSFRLTEQNQGETVVVAVCDDKEAQVIKSLSESELAERFKASLSAGSTMLDHVGCRLLSAKLR